MFVSFIPFLSRRCLCLVPSVANGARACALGCQAVVVSWPMGPGLVHWVAKRLLLRGQRGQGLRTGVPSGCCCVANGARACALGCQAVFVAWPMGPGLAHWVAKQLLFRGQWGQGLRTGVPSGCCCVANGARACALGCQAVVVAWIAGLEHWVAKRLLFLASVAACGVLLRFFFGAACFRLARLLSSVVCVFFFFLSFLISFSHCWRCDVVAASVRFARAHRLAGSCPVV